MSYKAIYIVILCLSPFLQEGASAQINLVPNPSFEVISSCPNSYGAILSATGWHTLKNGGGNPDLFNSCANGVTPNLGVPSNISNLGFQHSYFGNSYAGIDVANSAQADFREYIQIKLLSKLKNGNMYCIKFHVNLYNFCQAYITSLGAYLDSGNVTSPTFFGLAQGIPQVYSTQSLVDSINWIMIEGSFTATGIEEYITIGNFFPDSLSGIGFWGAPSNWGSYYYIDDVSAIDVSTLAFAGNDTTIFLGDSVFIGRPPEIGLNEDCIWSVAGNSIDTTAGMWVKPLATTTYVLQQTICGDVKYDTVVVTVNPNAVHAIAGSGHVYIYPNPASSSINIELKIYNENVYIQIMDLLGNELKNVKVHEEKSLINVDDLSNGVYFFHIKTSRGSLVKKIVIQHGQ